jgi:hypothetical protein
VTVLTAGQGVLSRLHDLRRLRDLPYLDLLEALHREIRLTARKLRDGEIHDEPEGLPVLRQILHAIEERVVAFRRAATEPQENG